MLLSAILQFSFHFLYHLAEPCSSADSFLAIFFVSMKYSTILLTVATVAAAGVTVQNPTHDQDSLGASEQYLVEIEPGNTQWVTEEEKWALRRVCAQY